MKKYRIDELKNRQVFTQPPEGYFEKLPGIVQARTAHRSTNRARRYWVGALKLVPAAALLVLIALYTGLFDIQQPVADVEQLLSEVTSDDIILYLEELDLTNEEILEEVDFEELTFESQDQQELLDNLDIEDEALIELFDELDADDAYL